MAVGWIGATLVAAAAQTARNATQARLTAEIGTVGATQVRFLFGLPFSVIFLIVALWGTGELLPLPDAGAARFALLGALSQIGATGLMLHLMRRRSFALVTLWLKAEPVIVALAALIILGERLPHAAFVAIAVATAGVIIASWQPVEGVRSSDFGALLAGMAAAGLFGLAAVGFRGAILALPSGGFLVRASTILVLSLTLQSAILLVWMALADRQALDASLRVWRHSLGAGFLGAFASQFWFLGFSLTAAANVRTLALIEIVMAAAVSWIVFGKPISGRQAVGMTVMAAGVALLLATQT
jgi:drug/metabolite transporter (DMT)-like permease